MAHPSAGRKLKTDDVGYEREDAPVPLREARTRLGQLLNTAHFGNRRVPLTDYGKEVAAVIGLEDLEYLRARDRRGAVVSPKR